MRKGTEIYQIFYNDETKESNDAGFLPLDNYKNDRPDWSEYWPIRKYLLENELKDDVYYGFFSPKFKQKTNLDSDSIYGFLDGATEDIVSFSPFFDQSAFPLNIFEQAGIHHHNILPSLKAAFAELNPALTIETLVMSSRDTIFCNFFVAKKRVWIRWLESCERIFSICELNNTLLGNSLNSLVNHAGGLSPTKVFVIERVISFLLITQYSDWSIKVFNPLALPFAPTKPAQFQSELLLLDSLKIAYSRTSIIEYINEFHQQRLRFLDMMK